MAIIADRGWLTENMNLTVFDVHNPVISNANLGIEFVLNLAIIVEGGISNFYHEIDVSGLRMMIRVM